MNRMLKRMGFFGVLALAAPALGSVNVDSAANYSGGWTNGSNGGGGFGAWSITADSGSGWAGNGIWDSSAAALDLGSAFGYVAKGAASSIYLERAFTTALAAGDSFRLDLGLNYDAGSGGNKGFSLRTADNRELVTVNQAGSQVITVNGVAALTNYGVNTMYWTFSQLSSTQVAVFATGRGGSETYVTTVTTNTASYLAKVRFHALAITNDADAERRQVYFDNLTLSQGTSSTNLFLYTVENNRATITGVLGTATGDIIVPAALGSYAVGAVGRAAFKDLTNITSIAFAGGSAVTNLGPAAFQGCTALAVAALPAGTTALPAGLFQDCASLAAVSIPTGVTAIGSAAFAECRSLTAVTLPPGLTTLGESVFLNCRSLASLSIPAGITSIPGQLCYECESLSALTLPAGVTNIGYAAFFNCRALAGLNLPVGLVSLERDAFHGCAGLAGLELDCALAGVGDEAFFGCTNLAAAYFYGGVETLADGVFGGCSSLASVYFVCDVPGLDTGAEMFTGSGSPAVYFLTEPSTWGTTFCGAATAEWTPIMAGPGLVQGNAFQFSVSWAKGQSVRLQASPSLETPAWSDGGTYVLSADGTCAISDTNWVSQASRYYRLVEP